MLETQKPCREHMCLAMHRRMEMGIRFNGIRSVVTPFPLWIAADVFRMVAQRRKEYNTHDARRETV